MAQVAQAHGGTELVHLRIGGHIAHVLGVLNAEVPQMVQGFVHLRVVAAYAAALDGVEHLGGMEAEHGGIAEAARLAAVFLHTKGMGRVVDHLQPVLFGNGVNGLGVT